MITNYRRPFFKKKVLIEGNCLFLMGPIGTFFARLSRYLENNNIKNFFIFQKLKLCNQYLGLMESEEGLIKK